MSKSSDSKQKNPIKLIVLVFLGGIVVGIVTFSLIGKNFWSTNNQAIKTIEQQTIASEKNTKKKETTQIKKTNEVPENTNNPKEDSTLFPAKNQVEKPTVTDSVSIINNVEKTVLDNNTMIAATFDNEEQIAKDELIVKRSINISLPKRNVTLDSLLINDKTPPIEDLIYIEFWRSPINYTGYKYRKNKLILFGFYEPDSVQLKLHNSKLALFYNNNVFLLEETENFKALTLKRKKQ